MPASAAAAGGGVPVEMVDVVEEEVGLQEVDKMHLVVLVVLVVVQEERVLLWVD